ncbi:sensor histidine kinase [Coralloluteibacterium stylophorae]|uniref:Sensor histidine kinase n=1 Tax=Coralloluteibacterium stylophorae TaxID=1776034 RepID=A0A8J7VR36_9GAMM|nr:sensor histidine kinase [Coralloluteibacterium stylophorae]MBS7456418.1 sensor histidine kinase [Coralloluteibacterium stylophorae]
MHLRLTIPLLRYVGFLTWAIVGMPLLYSWYYPELSGLAGSAMRVGWWLTAYLAFGAIYWFVTRSLGVRRTGWVDILMLLALTVAAIAVSFFNASGLGSILLMVVAGVLPWFLPLPLGASWLLVANLAVIPVFHFGLGFSPFEAVMQALLYALFCAFVFATGNVAMQQAEDREEQRRLNAELHATRTLLAESARLNERTRISRELHDLLGHHLTALSLNLEVAGHLSTGKAQEHVRQAHTLAKLLLTDVREAVSQIRDSGAIEISAALRALAEGVPRLDVRLQLPEHFALDDPERAHALLRCTQEIITNAVRHADARTLWLTFERHDDALHVHARDDGRGAPGFVAGNGLRGMRERLRAHGGSVEIRTVPGQGFALEIRMPLAGFDAVAQHAAAETDAAGDSFTSQTRSA